MPKFKIVCVLLAAVIAAAGTVLVINNLVGGGEIAPFEKPTTDPNTYLDLTEDVDINDSNADVREFLFIAHKVLLQSEGFYGVARGSTTAAGIKQNVMNTRYVIGEFDNKHVLKEMVTAGIVSNGYQLFMSGNNYIYRTGSVKALDSVNWSNEAQPLTEVAFYNDFGHRNDKLTGYILNWDTVLSGELTSVDDGLYTFHYVLDTDESPTYLRREMITNGGLKGEPTFSKCEIYVAMDANFNIKSLRTDCAYKADLGFLAADCTEDITEVIEPYNEDKLPYADFYEEFFDAEAGEIDKEVGALDVLLAMFGPYLGGEDLQVALSVDNDGAHLTDALLSISGLDISDLSKLQVAAKLGDVNVSYVHGDSTIYFTYQDFKGSTTVDGILGLVDTIMPLVGDGNSAVDLGALGDLDPASLLENLTFELYDNDTKCVVSLPISLGGIDIDANLYADVDGEDYTFTYATVAIGKVELTIAPQSWTVDSIVQDEYSEILGLADLIDNGKIALTASVGLTLDGTAYSVDADVLVDLATMNLQLSTTIDKYGKITATLADGVAYVSLGEIKVKLDTANINELIEQIQNLIGGEISVDMPELSTSDLLGALVGITATKRDGKVAFELSLDGIQAAIYLASVNGRWQLDSIAVSAFGIDANVVPSDALGEVTVPSDANNYADINELIDTFADTILSIINAKGYAISVSGNIQLDNKTYALDAALTLSGGEVHLIFTLSYNGVAMFKDAELWLVGNKLYLHAGDIRLAIELGESEQNDGDGEFTLDSLKSTLADVKGYNSTLDDVVDAVLSILDTTLEDVNFSELLSSMKFTDGQLGLTVDGGQFDLSKFTLTLKSLVNNGAMGLNLSLTDFVCGGVTLNITTAKIFAYDGAINGPGENEDFSTNLVIYINEFDSATNTSGETNVIYVNLDLLNGVVLARIETKMKTADGEEKTFLDVKYTFADKVLKLTNGSSLNVLVNIDNIADIVDRIDEIVREFAGDEEVGESGGDGLADLLGLLGADLDLKSIVNSLKIDKVNGNVLLTLSALGLDVKASFKDGLNSVTVPVELIESDLVITFSSTNIDDRFKDTENEFSKFLDSVKYVSIDQVFDDFYYGADGVESDNNGPIYNLVHTNSWLLQFTNDSEINVYDDETKTTTSYVIVAGSYVSFYYNMKKADDFKIRAHLIVQKDGDEFLYLDVAYIDGRLYATYDSRKNDGNKNELKATVSMDAINETLELLPALIEVIPQIGTLMDSLSDALSNMESKLTLGNISKILHSVTYETVDNKNVFTLKINGQAIDKNNFVDGKELITLKVSNYGDNGLSLDELSLTIGGVSVNIDGLVVTGSDMGDDGEFTYVNEYIYSYITQFGGVDDHMNFDSLYDLMSALLVTAGNTDELGRRSFVVDGEITANINVVIASLDLKIGVTLYADIDENGDSYFALKLTRTRTRATIMFIPMVDAYDDYGGNSYLLFSTKTGMITIARDSNRDIKLTDTWEEEETYNYCTRCEQEKSGSTCYTSEGSIWNGTYLLHGKDYMETRTRTVTKSKSRTETGLESAILGQPDYIKTVTPEEFMAHIVTDEDGNAGYLFELLNITSSIENLIIEQVNKPNENVYGVEDIFKGYTYSEAKMQFEVKADLSPISSALGTLTLTIDHDEGYHLTNLSGDLPIASIVKLALSLNHTTPGFGYAAQYVVDDELNVDETRYTRLWTDTWQDAKVFWQ